jgi:hypothetical protein
MIISFGTEWITIGESAWSSLSTDAAIATAFPIETVVITDISTRIITICWIPIILAIVCRPVIIRVVHAIVEIIITVIVIVVYTGVPALVVSTITAPITAPCCRIIAVCWASIAGIADAARRVLSGATVHIIACDATVATSHISTITTPITRI